MEHILSIISIILAIVGIAVVVISFKLEKANKEKIKKYQKAIKRRDERIKGLEEENTFLKHQSGYHTDWLKNLCESDKANPQEKLHEALNEVAKCDVLSNFDSIQSVIKERSKTEKEKTDTVEQANLNESSVADNSNLNDGQFKFEDPYKNPDSNLPFIPETEELNKENNQVVIEEESEKGEKTTEIEVGDAEEKPAFELYEPVEEVVIPVDMDEEKYDEATAESSDSSDVVIEDVVVNDDIPESFVSEEIIISDETDAAKPEDKDVEVVSDDLTITPVVEDKKVDFKDKLEDKIEEVKDKAEDFFDNIEDMFEVLFDDDDDDDED